MTDASRTSPLDAQPDPTPSSRRPDLEVSEVTGSGVSDGAACSRRLDGYKATCGLPAEYRIFGDPCSCTEVYDFDKCPGHPCCERCVADLRMRAVRVHRDREVTFRPVRVCSLVAS